MPRLTKDQVPEVKLDASGVAIQGVLTHQQLQGLFEAPGSAVIAIVELTSKSYTGHAQGEDKDPSVKLRVTLAEAARSDEERDALLEAMAAMNRKRRIDGTLDEVGRGPQDGGAILTAAFEDYPTHAEFEEHRERAGSRG